MLTENCPVETLTIPASVTKINNSAFKNCTSLRDVYSLMPRPLMIDASVFANVPVKGYCDLHVIEGSKVRYSSMDVWKDFAVIVEDAGQGGGGGGGTGIKGDVNADGVVDVGDVNAVLEIILENS